MNAQESQGEFGKTFNLILNGDFENLGVKGGQNPHKSQGWEWHHAITNWAGKIEIDSSITRNKNSKYSLKFTSNPYLNWGECKKAVRGKSSNRCRHCEIKGASGGNFGSEEGKETWYGFSFRLTRFPSDKRRFYIFQFHSTKEKKGEFFSPLIGLRLYGDSLVLSKRIWNYDSVSHKKKCCQDINFSSSQPLLANTWYDVELYVKWSQDKGMLKGRYKSEFDSLFTIFIFSDGDTILARETMLNPYSSYIKTGMYWAWDPEYDGNIKLHNNGWFSDTLSIYIDNVKAAESYENFVRIP